MLFGKNKAAEAASRPGVKFNRFSKMTVGSKISFVVIALLIV